jgi:hypothetical protein
MVLSLHDQDQFAVLRNRYVLETDHQIQTGMGSRPEPL